MPCRPTSSGGIHGTSPARRRKLVHSSSSRAAGSAIASRPCSITARACSSGWKVARMTSSDSGCSANSNSVTTPKLPPPPRRAQNRSACSSADVRRMPPPAVTTSAASRLSMVRPYRRISRPTPPPRVSPPAPVCETTPAGSTRPCSGVARSTSPSSAPPPTQARRACGSTRTWLSARRSITRPPSQALCPGIEWPPARTAMSRPSARAWRMAAATSRAEAGRAISAGRRSCMAFHIRRAAS